MKVAAKCILFAWDSVQCRRYEPGKGPLEDGLYEIDSEGELAALTTAKGEYVFQWPGHEGKTSLKPVPVRVAEPAKVPEPQEAAPAPRGRPMTEEHKAKLKAGREAARTRKMALAAA